MAVVTHILYAHTNSGNTSTRLAARTRQRGFRAINASRYKMLLCVCVFPSGTGWFGGFVPHWFRATGTWRRLRTGCHRGRASSVELLSAGGIGTVAGTIVGALIIGVLNNTLDLMNVSAFWQQIVQGLALLLALSFSTSSRIAVVNSTCSLGCYLPRRGCRIQPRVSTLGSIQ